MRIRKLNLSHFRNYDAARVDLSTAKAVVISGDNGAGKTNILEAISFLSPGKGLRGTDLSNVQNRSSDAHDVWTVSAEVEDMEGELVRVGTGIDRQHKRRVVRINGEDASSQSELNDVLSVIWLTPQMDGLFLSGASERRRFLDRLVTSYIPSHGRHINRYEKQMRERAKLLQAYAKVDEKWIGELESQMASDAVSIAASRLQLLETLQVHVNRLHSVSSLFPVPELGVDNWIERAIQDSPAVEVEDQLKTRLLETRQLDKEMRRTNEGVHRTDMTALYKGMPAAQCSTGEQKALLVSIILGHALMMQAEKGFVPIILLDEVAAHLDEDRREQLFQVLLSLNGQVWLTGTEEELFNTLKPSAVHLRVKQGSISQ